MNLKVTSLRPSFYVHCYNSTYHALVSLLTHVSVSLGGEYLHDIHRSIFSIQHNKYLSEGNSREMFSTLSYQGYLFISFSK